MWKYQIPQEKRILDVACLFYLDKEAALVKYLRKRSCIGKGPSGQAANVAVICRSMHSLVKYKATTKKHGLSEEDFKNVKAVFLEFPE